MAGISTQVQLYDRVSGPMGNIVKSLNNAVTAFRSVQVAGNQVFNDLAYTRMKEEVESASEALNKLENSLNNGKNGQDKFNASLNHGSSLVGSLGRKVMGLVGTYASLRGAQKLIGTSDNWTQTQARLGLVAREGESVVDVQNKIYQASQRSRSGMMDFAASVSKLGITAGKAFSSTDEIVSFSELMNKNFVIGGASQQESAAAMYQLTQAMASGRLQGDEYRSIIENAPLLNKSIEDYMRNVQGAQGSMKEWASEGLLTADVIKAALFRSADETEERFAKMPKTWAQVWEMFKNDAIIAFEPVLKKINEIANSEGFNKFVQFATQAMHNLASFTIQVFDWIGNAVSWTADNWDWLSQVIKIAAVAFGIFKIAVMGATIAQWAYNTALYGCPIVWILGIIVLAVAAIYGIIEAINQVTGATFSATGFIFGIISSAFAAIYNVVLATIEGILSCVEYIVNPFVAFGNFLANVWKNPITSIIYLFRDMADHALKVLQDIAEAMEFVFGGDKMSSTVQGWRNAVHQKAEDMVNNAKARGLVGTENEYNEVLKKLDITSWAEDKRISYKNAFDNGYQFGEGVDKFFKNPLDIFGGQGGGSEKNYNNTPAVPEYAKDIGNIANDTSDIKKSVTASSEELKYLRMIAERQAINKFTTAEIKIDMTGMQNSISSEMDVDGMINALQKKLTQAIVSSPKGVHV